MTDTPQAVLMVTHSLSRRAGGLFYSVRGLSQSLSALGQPTQVVGLWDEDFARDRAAWAPLEPRAFRALGPAALGLAPGLFPVVQTAAAAGALIHLHGLWKLTSLAALRASRACRSPVVVSPRGMLDAWALHQAPRRKRVARWLYEDANLGQAACIHVLSEAELDQVRSFGLRNPVALVRNGVELPDLEGPGTGDPVPEWSGQRVALFLSRLHRKKGLDEFIPAFAACQSSMPGWSMAIAGPDEGGYAADLRRQIAATGCDSIRLIGPQFGAQKDAWLRRADLFVLPSFSEGLPMALLEAMAYALPVLITPACNLPEADRVGAGVTVQPDRQALAAGLRRLGTLSPEERQAMGQKGRALAAQHFGWDKVAAEMRDVYRWARGTSDKPDCVHTEPAGITQCGR